MQSSPAHFLRGPSAETETGSLLAYIDATPKARSLTNLACLYIFPPVAHYRSNHHSFAFCTMSVLAPFNRPPPKPQSQDVGIDDGSQCRLVPTQSGDDTNDCRGTPSCETSKEGIPISTKPSFALNPKRKEARRAEKHSKMARATEGGQGDSCPDSEESSPGTTTRKPPLRSSCTHSAPRYQFVFHPYNMSPRLTEGNADSEKDKSGASRNIRVASLRPVRDEVLGIFPPPPSPVGSFCRGDVNCLNLHGNGQDPTAPSQHWNPKSRKSRPQPIEPSFSPSGPDVVAYDRLVLSPLLCTRSSQSLQSHFTPANLPANVLVPPSFNPGRRVPAISRPFPAR